MKDKTMSYGMWLALGMIVLGLGVTAYMIFIRQAIDDPTGKKPVIPTAFNVQVEQPALTLASNTTSFGSYSKSA